VGSEPNIKMNKMGLNDPAHRVGNQESSCEGQRSRYILNDRCNDEIKYQTCHLFQFGRHGKRVTQQEDEKRIII